MTAEVISHKTTTMMMVMIDGDDDECLQEPDVDRGFRRGHSPWHGPFINGGCQRASTLVWDASARNSLLPRLPADRCDQ
jgi:hypothetical protein